MNFLFTYHPLLLLIIVVFAALASFWLYYRAMLAGLRFLTLFLIGFLLLGLILEKLDQKTQNPLLFILHDQSESIVQTADSSFYKSTYIENLKSMGSRLEKKFEVIPYGFSNSIQTGIDSLYSNKLTDISQAINQVYDQYENRNIGAIILSTDGIFNKGQNPIYTVNRKVNIPVFTIGLGDTTIAKDLFISDVVSNDVAFLGNDFPIKVDLQQNGFNNSKVKIDLLSNSKIIKSKTIKFENDQTEASIDFQLTASRVGYQKFTVRITELEGEFTFKNNSKNFYLNVIDGRQKILLTYGFTHPDISALNYVIETNKNYDLTVTPISELNGDLTGYDLIIVHNYQSTVPELNEIISTNEVPVLHIIGVNSDFRNLVNANIGISGVGNNTEDVVFQSNTGFKDIIFDVKTTKLLNAAPPLNSPQGGINFSEGVQIIAYQKIGSITLSKPLIYASEKGENKYAVILGEGIWRWRLFDKMQNETTENFANFFSKVITYLAVKENKDPFKINVDREFEESDEVIVRAELYNASYQLTNDSEVKYKLINAEGKVFDYTFFKTNEDYILELGKLDQGIYNWEARTMLDAKNYVKKGAFVVRETKKEMMNLSANHRLLSNIASNTKAAFYLPNSLNKLEADLIEREDIVAVTYQEKRFDDAIDYKWLFFLIVFFLTIEWFIRKFQGGY